MSKEPHLKTRNLPLVILFILWCVALYLAFHVAPGGFFSRLRNTISDLHARDSIFMILSPLLAVVLTGIISSANKARLIFWRIKHALPGHRAFSVLAPRDPRIDMDCLRARLSPWPSTPEAENKEWYALYKQVSGQPTVLHSHGSFLLARDIGTIALLFLVLGSVGLAIMLRSWIWPCLYACLMLIHYLTFIVVARNHGHRFVCNVLAEAIAVNKPQT